MPRFNTRYVKDSIKYRGAVLWNAMTAKHRDLAQSSSFGSLKKKLNNLVAFRGTLILISDQRRLVILEWMGLHIINFKSYGG